jgi:hypothetical protein
LLQQSLNAVGNSGLVLHQLGAITGQIPQNPDGNGGT